MCKKPWKHTQYLRIVVLFNDEDKSWAMTMIIPLHLMFIQTTNGTILTQYQVEQKVGKIS